MTLVFMPFGAFLAGLFLGTAVTLFAIALRALDRGAVRFGDSVLPGLIEGLRDWRTPGRHGEA